MHLRYSVTRDPICTRRPAIPLLSFKSSGVGFSLAVDAIRLKTDANRSPGQAKRTFNELNDLFSGGNVSKKSSQKNLGLDTMTIGELSAESGIQPRTIRKYISLGIVAPPTGRTRAALYSRSHLVSLLDIRRLITEGHSLGRARDVLTGFAASVASSAEDGADVTLMRALRVAKGVILLFDEGQSRFTTQSQRAIAAVTARACIEHPQADRTTRARAASASKTWRPKPPST